MNHICTWVCVDSEADHSYFPQTGKLSSAAGHQAIYWRCVLIFFITSIRFNRHQRHVLFTNVKELPVVDGKHVSAILEKLDVEIVHTDFKYKTPRNYYYRFQNQFYEFSILEHIVHHRRNSNDTYLVLDSDCIFLHPADELFAAAAKTGFISFEDDVAPDYVINGLSRNDLRSIYQELLSAPVEEVPGYHLGEFFLASVDNIEKIFSDFRVLWPVLLERHATGLKKFNEEAHTLSYLYFKNGLKAGPRDRFMKRIWTNPAFYRNVHPSDKDLAIWHLPAEKTFGLGRLYELLMHDTEAYGMQMPDEEYRQNVQAIMGIPHLGIVQRCRYYVLSYQRALMKRFQKLSLVRRFSASV